jgi:alkylhydroperoxidase family enzyme
MARATEIRRAGQYPASADAETRAGLDELFAGMFPGNPDGAIDHNHSGMAVAANSPKLAAMMGQMSRFVVLELGWSQRKALSELAIRTVNHHYGSTFSNDARLGAAKAAGLSGAQLAAVPDWRSDLFDAEQKLTIEYAGAVLRGAVDDALFARMVATFGEKDTVECTAAIGWWALWASLIEATGAGR